MQQMVRNSEYGFTESNGLENPQAYHEGRKDAQTVDWTEKGLRVTRFRVLTDPGFPMYDVSYCHGILDGNHVDVELPFSQLEKRRWKSEILSHAKRDGVYAKGLGIFDAISALS